MRVEGGMRGAPPLRPFPAEGAAPGGDAPAGSPLSPEPARAEPAEATPGGAGLAVRPHAGRRRHTETRGTRGRTVSDRSWRGDRDIALVSSLRAAAVRIGAAAAGSGRGASTSVALRADELRSRVRTRRAGRLFVLVVDLSGSMADRILVCARRVVHELALRAHLARDRIALVAFRGRGAAVVLPPTCSVTLAQRRLGALPTGGTTPLAAGLAAGLRVVRSTRRRDPEVEPVLVMVTDGRANVGSRPGHLAVLAEVDRACRAVRRTAGLAVVMLDATEAGKDGRDAAHLAAALGARTMSLEGRSARAHAHAIAAMVR